MLIVDGFQFLETPRPDGSVYLRCPELPGFHFILATGEDDTELRRALSEFRTLYDAAHNAAHATQATAAPDTDAGSG